VTPSNTCGQQVDGVLPATTSEKYQVQYGTSVREILRVLYWVFPRMSSTFFMMSLPKDDADKLVSSTASDSEEAASLSDISWNNVYYL
jgi:hypothetical protein